jgi:Ca2+-binding EF-hand superfamily protein
MFSILWQLADVSGDGFISPDEIHDLFTRIRDKPSEAGNEKLQDFMESQFHVLDEDGDGQVSLEEFMNSCGLAGAYQEDVKEQKRRNQYKCILEFFEEADIDKDGYVSLYDVHAMFRRRQRFQIPTEQNVKTYLEQQFEKLDEGAQDTLVSLRDLMHAANMDVWHMSDKKSLATFHKLQEWFFEVIEESEKSVNKDGKKDSSSSKKESKKESKKGSKGKLEGGEEEEEEPKFITYALIFDELHIKVAALAVDGSAATNAATATDDVSGGVLPKPAGAQKEGEGKAAERDVAEEDPIWHEVKTVLWDVEAKMKAEHRIQADLRELMEFAGPKFIDLYNEHENQKFRKQQFEHLTGMCRVVELFPIPNVFPEP